MGKAHLQPLLPRLKSDLIAATFALAVIAAGVAPARAQDPEPPNLAAAVDGVALEPAAQRAPAVNPAPERNSGIDWRPVLSESLLFLTAQHLARLTEARTSDRLSGPFVNDWFDSVRSLNRFSDGGHIVTNWVAHPMMGSVSAHILGQNDPEYLQNKIGSGERYWKSKGKQFIFATIYSVQFEIGPLSESSIGNVHQAGIDFVLTSTLGTLWSVGEDVAAQHVLRPMRATHPKWANALTVLLNPTRAFANMLAFKRPWACETASCY